ncbi:MAG: triose-phosphate isomerase [Myxococcota bacterium]
MTPKPLVCANWKMNQTAREAEAWARAFARAIEDRRAHLDASCEVAVAPAHPVLDRLGRALAGSAVALAAQNVHADERGAFTGEVSLEMLEDLGCRYALLGHSERRQLYGERDAAIAAKAQRLQGSTVRPILCVGETLDEREHDQTLDVVRTQLGAVLDRATDLRDELVVAYEPVWAIGTGKTATPEIAQSVHAALRAMLVERLGDAGTRIRLLYGGSVKPSNARELLSQADIDGALVGGASLDPQDFARIALAALPAPA